MLNNSNKKWELVFGIVAFLQCIAAIQRSAIGNQCLTFSRPMRTRLPSRNFAPQPRRRHTWRSEDFAFKRTGLTGLRYLVFVVEITSQVANNNSNSPQITSQLATPLESKSNHKHITLKHLTSQPCNGKSFVHTQKRFGHRNGRSPGKRSIGKFFLCYIVLLSTCTYT